MKTLDSANLRANERRAIEEAASVLKSDMPVTRVLLFGSRARGRGAAGSDVDLLVLTSGPVTPELRRGVSERLFEVGLENDTVLASVVVSQEDWSVGLVRQMLLHSEVERDGCEV
ncbi:MAG TPA: nucleotidyltransferase domain-containing protein [Phycisphaerae bacterium]|nr:nucleotidyltransferase domain-containing protein [Phycisphaerae bacterium]